MSRHLYDLNTDYNSPPYEQYLSQSAQGATAFTAHPTTYRALASNIGTNQNLTPAYYTTSPSGRLVGNMSLYSNNVVVAQYGPKNNSFHTTVPPHYTLHSSYPNHLQNAGAINSHYHNPPSTTCHGFHSGGYNITMYSGTMSANSPYPNPTAQHGFHNGGYNNTEYSGTMNRRTPNASLYRDLTPPALILSSSQAAGLSVADGLGQLQLNFNAFQQEYNYSSFSIDPFQQDPQYHNLPHGSTLANKSLSSCHPPGQTRAPKPFSYQKAVSKAMKMTEAERAEELATLHLRIQAINDATGKLDRESGKLIKFTIFTCLPTELQFKIWGHAIPAPRAVTVSVYNFVPKVQTRTRFPPSTALRCFSQPPAMLSACKGSREILLSVYTTCLEMRTSKRKIRLNGASDKLILLAHTRSMESKLASYCMENISSLSKVACVALSSKIVTGNPDIFAGFFQGGFESLREIVLLWGAKDGREMAQLKGKVAVREVSNDGMEVNELLKKPLWKDKCFQSESKGDGQEDLIEVKNGMIEWVE